MSNKVKLIKKMVVIFAGVIVVFFCTLGVLRVAEPIISAIKGDEDDDREEDNKRLFTESTDITVYDVKRQMSPIGELATYKMTYDGKEKIEDYAQLWNWNVPLTKHTIDVEYNGVIKVGYEMRDIDISVDSDKKVINVVLPKVKVLDNYIDTYETVDDNNIINSIKSDEVENYLDEMVKPKELEKAIENGIYEDAEENAKITIMEQLSYFEKYGFTIEFSTNNKAVI